MTSKDKAKVADRRGRRAEPAPESHAITGGEEAVGESMKVNNYTVAGTGSRETPMTDANAKPDNESSSSLLPGFDDSHGQHGVAAEGDADRMSLKLTTPKIPTGKNARIAELVSRNEGAGLSELASVTGWQRYTVRAALTRLRQVGFAVELRTGEDGRRTYHHVAGAEASS